MRTAYTDFSKSVGLLTRNERTQAYGFNRSISAKAVWARKKAGEQTVMPEFAEVTIPGGKNISENGLTSGGNGSIINKTAITDTAITRVPKVNIPGFTDEQNEFIQAEHKALLQMAHDMNDDNEVAFVISDGKRVASQFGTDDLIQFDSNTFTYGNNFTVLHNHPRNSSFSFVDISFFTSNDKVANLTIVKNNGKVEILSRAEKFDIQKWKNEINRAIKNTNNLDEAVQLLLKRNKGGNIIWEK
jgi:hypothetical protein